MLTYTIEVITGDEPEAETEANVWIKLIGSRGDSGKRILYKSDNEKKFQQGQKDIFKIEAVSLDDIEKIDIGHDNTEKGIQWDHKQ